MREREIGSERDRERDGERERERGRERKRERGRERGREREREREREIGSERERERKEEREKEKERKREKERERERERERQRERRRECDESKASENVVDIVGVVDAAVDNISSFNVAVGVAARDVFGAANIFFRGTIFLSRKFFPLKHSAMDVLVLKFPAFKAYKALALYGL